MTESGGVHETKGLLGEYGALQYKSSTWTCASKAVMNGEVLSQTKNNEWYVSVLTVQRLLNDNPSYTAYDIGMIWNGSLCGSERPVAKSGYNKDVYYNTVTHAKKVLANYYQLNAKE